MSKIKIHELAKKLNLNSKELVEKAKQIGMDVKNHLSGITEDEAEKLEKQYKQQSNDVQSEKKEKPVANKKEKSENNAPVIIRREVIIKDDEQEKKKEEVKEVKKEKIDNSNYMENNRNKDYNIVYRNKPVKPMTVSELFGINKKEKKEEIVEKKEIEKDNMKTENTSVIEKEVNIQKKEEKKVVQDVKPKEEGNTYVNQSKPSYDRNNGYNNQRSNYNNQNNNQRNNNVRQFGDKDRNNNYNQRRNQNGYNNNYNNHNNNSNYNNGNVQRNNQFKQYGDRNNNNNNQKKNWNNNNNGNNYNRRPLDEKGIDKNIKNIMAIEMPEKENVREYSNKLKDKQKNNRPEEQKKKSKKNNLNNDFDSDKLKSLKQHNKLSNMFNEGEMLDYYDLSTERGRRGKKKPVKDEERNKQKIFKLTEITIPSTISVKDLASEMKITSGEVIKKLIGYGILATINNEIDFDTAFLVAGEFGITAKKKDVVTDEDKLFDDSEDTAEELAVRPPVIVVMGHVDHGKTSLLDAIRSTNVIERESGGITQHIGAYQVKVNGRDITFLDTPGHEAFTSMRARGAQITDIAILVVAANDGVMPQTIEAINHAKAANIPIIVAVNKMDLPGANMDKIKQELTEYDLVPEEWGGETIFVPISAKQKTGIDTLLEMVLLQADMLELKANPKKQAKGTVIEAKLDKARGPVATMLVQRGELNIGDTIVVGSSIGRIRTMVNAQGKKVKFAGPSTPVEITGLTTVPQSGDTFYEVKDEKTAKHLIEKRIREQRDKNLNANTVVTLDDLFNKIENENLKQLNLIVKADVQGSVEAIKQAMEKLSNNQVRVKVIHSNVGGVTESDVTLAKVSNAIIIAFNVRPEPMAKEIAEKEKIQIRQYSVIYNAIDDVEAAMKGLLDPVYKETVLGNAEIRQVFKVSNVGTIAGCYVTNGKVARNAGVRLLRNNIVIYEGKLVSLKRFKEDAKEVTSGFECGIQLENYNDIQEGDILEVYIKEEIKQ